MVLAAFIDDNSTKVDIRSVSPFPYFWLERFLKIFKIIGNNYFQLLFFPPGKKEERERENLVDEVTAFALLEKLDGESFEQNRRNLFLPRSK